MTVLILIDTGRVPFDLIEAESELIAGLLTELSSVEFAYVFF
jgi:NADH:ubiquinone oxidoreductase subunit H